MVITLSPELESALNEQARRQGVAAELLALQALRERFLEQSALGPPRDEWERRLLGLAKDCGVSLSNAALSRESAVRVMAYLIDTNILVRLANSADASHAVAARAVLDLHRRGETAASRRTSSDRVSQRRHPAKNCKRPGTIDGGH